MSWQDENLINHQLSKARGLKLFMAVFHGSQGGFNVLICGWKCEHLNI